MLLRIGTRDSQLAVWQATLVQDLLKDAGVPSELVFIKSEGDINTVTPLYELGVQGIFTKTLDAALLNDRIDLAVHSMKDVPTLPARGIRQAAVLKRASFKDIFVYKDPAMIEGWHLGEANLNYPLEVEGTIATSSIRRIAQWRHRYPLHKIENLRGNVNTRLRKVQEHDWNGAIFAAAGLERIHLRPQNSVDLDWMLPAPAQGAIMVVCRQDDDVAFNACQPFNDTQTALCTRIERDFLRTLLGGCSTPISALAEVTGSQVFFKGNIVSTDGKQKVELEKVAAFEDADALGVLAANELLSQGGNEIVQHIKQKGTTF